MEIIVLLPAVEEVRRKAYEALQESYKDLLLISYLNNNDDSLWTIAEKPQNLFNDGKLADLLPTSTPVISHSGLPFKSVNNVGLSR